MTGSCSHWQAASCQVRGSGHQRTGIPCQDRALAWLRPRPALCVLDGRGSAPLSHLGAQAASQALRAMIRRSEPQLVRILDTGSDALAALGWHGFAHRLYHTAALTQLKLAAQHDRVDADFEFTLSVAVIGRQQVQRLHRWRHFLPRVRLVPELDAREGPTGVCGRHGQRRVPTPA